VDSTFGIAEAPAAIERVAARRAVGGKVLLLGTGGGLW